MLGPGEEPPLGRTPRGPTVFTSPAANPASGAARGWDPGCGLSPRSPVLPVSLQPWVLILACTECVQSLLCSHKHSGAQVSAHSLPGIRGIIFIKLQRL